MRYLPGRLPFLCVLLIFSPNAAAAQSGLWTEIRESDIAAPLDDRLVIPNQYRTLRLPLDQLRSMLQSAPSEQDYYEGAPGLLVQFPLPDGRMLAFEVWEAPVMAPELGAQFPDIRSYAGKSADPAGVLTRFDISPAGLHVLFLNTSAGSAFIDPYARGNTADYICFFKKDFVKRTGNAFACGVEEQLVSTNASDRSAGDCGNLRQYRLALACTGEYANFHGAFGADKAPALAAMNTSMTRVNGVFERDAGVRMVIVANNTNVIFTDPATDPYTNNNGTTMLGQNQTTCDANIGSANYDIGHVFSTGGGGVASLSCVCNASFKARGVTGSPSPVGDPFDIDYVAHEMGHQFGANHTQYNNCNRNNATAMEPGSASTIMGYAGICSPDVQSNSDDYFHAISLQEIGAFVTGSGNVCATLVPNGNAAPSLPTLTNRTIPKSTPFLLAAAATDPNGDVLSYCWEQMDPYVPPAQPMPPASTNTTGPMFRSLLPVGTTARYFPNFDDLLSGVNSDWEELPSVARTMSFRLTVRDNHANGGCTTEKNMTVTTSGTTGPFAVTVPNGGESYALGSQQTVIWNVAGSNGSPVNCAQVDILLSTDGGASFSTLVANTPNDGTEPVVLPNVTTSLARILIQSVGNVFFDVSDQNFSIGVSSYCGQQFYSTNVPVVIPASGTPTVTSTLSVNSGGTIDDVNVIGLTGTHTYVSDLVIKLQSPAGTQRTLFSQLCSSQDNFNLNFDDEATLAYSSIPCPPTSGGFYKPFQALSAFDGQDATGTWTLIVQDLFNTDGGQLNSWGLSFCAATFLPVEWSIFTARYAGGAVRLDWTTESENNNKGFMVERSVERPFLFQTIGWIDGHGTSVEKRQYGYVDIDVQSGQLYYYRLRQVDFDGKETLSDVQAVSTGGPNGGALAILPNPAASGYIRLQWSGAGEGPWRLMLTDASGRVLLEQAWAPETPDVYVSGLPEGVYLVRLRSGSQFRQGRFVKR
jgi:subtilisin-like proprotein convertase family protein